MALGIARGRIGAIGVRWGIVMLCCCSVSIVRKEEGWRILQLWIRRLLPRSTEKVLRFEPWSLVKDKIESEIDLVDYSSILNHIIS